MQLGADIAGGQGGEKRVEGESSYAAGEEDKQERYMARYDLAYERLRELEGRLDRKEQELSALTNLVVSALPPALRK